MRYIAAFSSDINWHYVFNCGGVILELVCIVAAIVTGDLALVLDCIDANDWSYVFPLRLHHITKY
jgi:hypothetical protein